MNYKIYGINLLVLFMYSMYSSPKFEIRTFFPHESCSLKHSPLPKLLQGLHPMTARLIQVRLLSVNIRYMKDGALTYKYLYPLLFDLLEYPLIVRSNVLKQRWTIVL